MALTTVPAELANLDGAVTVNESSADVDFRIESNGYTHMLFVDGGANTVNIGGSTDQGGLLNLEGYDADMLVLHRTADTGDQSILFKDHGDHNATISGKNGGALELRTNGNTLAMGIDSSQNTNLSGSLVIHGDADTATNAQSGAVGIMLYASSDTAYVTSTSNGNSHRYLELSAINSGTRNDNQLVLSYVDKQVGIGTNAPDTNSFGAGAGVLAVASATGSAKTAMLNLMGDGNDTSTARVASVFFNDQSGTGAGKTIAGIEAYRNSNHATDPGGALHFSTNIADGSYTERFRIQADGGLRIGGSSISVVTGGVSGSLTLADDASYVIATSGTATAGGGILIVYDTSSGDNAVFRCGYGASVIISASSSYAASDTDNKFCVIVSGHQITFKNRIGASRNFYIAHYGAGNYNYNP